MDKPEDGQPLSITKGKSGKATPADHTTTDRQPALADYLRIFSYATRWDVCVYTVGALSSIAAGITLPLMNILFGQLAAQFAQHAAPSSSPSSAADFEGLLSRQALYILALFLGRWALNAVNKFCFRATGLRLSAAVRLHYLQRLLHQSVHALDALPAGAPAAAVTAAANTLQVGVSERLGTLLQFAGTVGAALVVAFVWSWELTLVVSSLVVYSFVVMAVALPVLLASHAAVARAEARATAVASEALGAIRLVMAAGAQDYVLRRYERWVQEAKRHSRKTAPVFGIYLGLIYLGIFGSYGLAFWYGIKRFVSQGAGGVSVVIVVLMSVMMVLTSIERLSTPLTAISKAMVAACEFFAVIDAPVPERGGLKLDMAGGRGTQDLDLVFENVTFAYPSRPGTKVLDGLDLRIRAGLNTAIVGPSGSGKSTIVALLERWYSLHEQPLVPRVVQPEPKNESDDGGQEQAPADAVVDENVVISGAIMVAGHSIDEFDVQWWRSQIGLVQQEPFLFNDSIFDNVARGLIGTQWAGEPEAQKRDLVISACKEASAHEFICRLPEGYDSRIGDGGLKLSGGQRQRVAIARSIVKKPRIIILDEATSAIDVHGERIVQAALDRISQNCTTITIAHRLSTIKKADRIVVFNEGRTVEEGTHDDLMRSPSGHYSRLVHAQALNNLADTDNIQEKPDLKAASPEVQERKSLEEREDVIPDLACNSDSEAKEGAKPTPASFRSFATIIHQQRIHWLFFAGIIVSAVGIAAATPIQAWLFAKVVGVFTLQGDELRRASDFWALMWLALAGGVGLSYCAAAWIGVGAQSLVGATCKTSYLRGMLYQKLAFFDDDANAHGTLTGRVASDAKHMEELLGLNLVISLSGVLTVAGCLVISLAFGWKLALVGLFVTMPLMLASGLWKLRQEIRFDQMNSAVFAESAQFATEAIGAVRTVAAFNLEASILARYEALLDGHVRAAVRKARANALLFGFTDSATLGCQALVFLYGGRLLLRGEYTLEAFFVCFMAIIQGAENASLALAMAPNAAQAFTAANRILRVQTSAEVGQPETADEKAAIPDMETGARIELRDVHFRYPTRDVPIFQGTSLTIEKGQYAAFVGPSGCGKTTIISLLERFYDLEPDSGEIFCNGINIQNLNRYAYRQNLSLVAQEPTMFQGTIRDNILLGAASPDQITQARIEEVCRDASIHEFVVSLPDGYGTDKQRLALARALVRDPKILLLDEATSALDSASERAVQRALEKARRGRTMVVVAHRLSTIQNADVIFVMHNGAVVEKGTHEELLWRRGGYWNMCQSQAMDQ
ncbi:uncharacterized protein PG998_012975 [Apiospora kogelbergensis]|uniref:uncharacterized protein n=1 Tax=Apiospora kogelbergensis TaxID=1337665 RepID=UPI00312D1F3A